jgi:hypothetical protein
LLLLIGQKSFTRYRTRLGVNITGSIFLGILGVLADSLNHLVFTMPFLPSEAEEIKLLLQQQMKMFHFSLFTNFMVSLSDSK